MPYQEDPRVAYQQQLDEAMAEMNQQNAHCAAVREERESFQRRQRQYFNRAY